MPSTPEEHWDYTIREWSNEPFIRLTNALPKQVDIIFDIGANAGGFTYIMKKKYPEAKVVCFEPVVQNFNILKEKVDADCRKVGIYYGARESKVLWKGHNVGTFFVEHINAGEPRIDTGEKIELITIEEVGIKPDLIKLDVEGAEENIIEHSTLIKETPYIIVEWHPEHVNPLEFFGKHLPNHKIVVNLENKQFFLCLK